MKTALAFAAGFALGLASLTAGHWTQTTDQSIVANCPHGTHPTLWGTSQDSLGGESRIYKCEMDNVVSLYNATLHA